MKEWFPLPDDDERTVPRWPAEQAAWPVRLWRQALRLPEARPRHWSDPRVIRHGPDTRGPVTAETLLDSGFLHRLETLNFNARRAVTGGLVGEHPSRRKASSVEFADYRSYVAGDDFRLIDWNVYARLGELCLKLTQARENLTLHLLIDASGSMAWGDPAKIRHAQRIAAALGCVALATYDTVVLTVLRDGEAQTYPTLRGRSALRRLLEHLVEIPAEGRTDLRLSTTAFCSRRQRTGVAVLLSDLWVDAIDGDEQAPYADALSYLRRAGFSVSLLHILDKEEISPTLDGAVELVDVETGQKISITITPALLANYERRFRERQNTIKEACTVHAATYIPAPTSVSVEALILHELRRMMLVT